ncbi:hypothetical protein BC826DRAFT_1179665 [Russula brevipes]|nr:hypothetical protein BC826DRAFT_1179665 [Russula brevipes]
MSNVAFRGQTGFMWYRGSHCVCAHAKATTTRDVCLLLSPLPPRQGAHQAPRRSQRRRSHQWFLASLRHSVRQTSAALAVALLVASASGNVAVAAGVDRSARVMGWEKEATMTGLRVKSVCWVQGFRKNKGGWRKRQDKREWDIRRKAKGIWSLGTYLGGTPPRLTVWMAVARMSNGRAVNIALKWALRSCAATWRSHVEKGYNRLLLLEVGVMTAAKRLHVYRTLGGMLTRGCGPLLGWGTLAKRRETWREASWNEARGVAYESEGKVRQHGRVGESREGDARNGTAGGWAKRWRRMRMRTGSAAGWRARGLMKVTRWDTNSFSAPGQHPLPDKKSHAGDFDGGEGGLDAREALVVNIERK